MTASSLPNPTPIADPDREVVDRARSGDFAAFEQLVAKYERPLYALALRIVHQAQDAEEVVQDALMSVVQHLDDFQHRSTFHTWLVRIATHQALKVLRKRKGLKTTSLTPTAADGEDSPLPHPDFIANWRDNPEQIAQQHEVQQVLAEALETLDEKYRMVFLLRDVEGLSTEEAADALGITVTNTKVRLLRARLMLREQLTRRFGDESARVIHSHDHDD